VPPLVSVCIPAYRAEAFIGDTIRSALAQTIDDIEVIVVDDASPDRTVAVAQGFVDRRVQVHPSQANIGAAANWNRATALCSGRYVKLLCSDDTIAPRCLEAEVAVLEAHPDVILTSARRNIVDARGETIVRDRGIRHLAGWHSGDAAIRAVVRSGTNLIGEPSAALIRRADLLSVGPWSSAEAYMIDLDMWCRLLQQGAFYGVNETLATFRVSEGSWSADLIRDQAHQARTFFRRLHRAGFVGDFDLRLGLTRATVLAAARRALFRIRMRA